MNVLRSFLRTLGTTPLVFPVLLVVAVVSALAAPWAARRTGLAGLPAALLLFSFGAVLAITLTPGIGGDPSAPITCKGLVPAPSLSELWSLTNENGQNVLLYVPLGLFIGLIPRRSVLVGAGIAAAAMPFAIEGTPGAPPGVRALLRCVGRHRERAGAGDRARDRLAPRGPRPDRRSARVRRRPAVGPARVSRARARRAMSSSTHSCSRPACSW